MNRRFLVVELPPEFPLPSRGAIFEDAVAAVCMLVTQISADISGTYRDYNTACTYRADARDPVWQTLNKSETSDGMPVVRERTLPYLPGLS